MKTSTRSHQTQRTTVGERARLLAAFDRSGLSAAAFARQYGIHYTTFCGWRQQRAKLKPSPALVQVELTAPPAAEGLLVELTAPPAAEGLLVELGGNARLRIESARQIALAAQLLQHLNTARPC
jgi:transposase-like protein